MNQDFEKFINAKKAQGVSPLTIRNYEFSLKDFLNFVKNVDVQKITISNVDSFLASMVSEYKSSTINQMKRYLKTFFTYHKREDLAAHIKYAKLPHEFPIIPPEDKLVADIDKIQDVTAKAICMFLYGTGLRKGELLTLKKNNLKFTPENRVILIGEKTHEPRETIFPLEVQEFLRYYWKFVPNSDYVFVNKKGQPFSMYQVFYITKKHLNLKPHALRDAFATHLLKNGASFLWIMKFLGHKNIESTQWYAQITMHQDEEALAKHPYHQPSKIEKIQAVNRASGIVSAKMSNLENLLDKVLIKNGQKPTGMIGNKIGLISKIKFPDKKKHEEILKKINHLNDIRVAFQHHDKISYGEDKVTISTDEGYVLSITSKEEKFSIDNFQNKILSDFSEIQDYLSQSI